jgi:hypothetical protein
MLTAACTNQFPLIGCVVKPAAQCALMIIDRMNVSATASLGVPKKARLIGLALRRMRLSIYARLKVLRAARSRPEPDPEASGS